MIYLLNAEGVPSASKVPEGIITASGLYKGTIHLAKEVVSKTGAVGVRLYFEADEGGFATLTLYTKNAKGKLTKAHKTFLGIMAVLRLRRVLPSLTKVVEFDYRRGKEVEVNRACFPELHGRKIIFEITATKFYKQGKYPTYSYGLIGVFDYETGQTPTEIIENLPSLKILPKE